jgi:hypothetical protein
MQTDLEHLLLNVAIQKSYKFQTYLMKKKQYCGVAPRGGNIERPLLINGYSYLEVSLSDIASNSWATDLIDRCLGSRLTNRPARGNGSSHITRQCKI